MLTPENNRHSNSRHSEETSQPHRPNAWLWRLWHPKNKVLAAANDTVEGKGRRTTKTANTARWR